MQGKLPEHTAPTAPLPDVLEGLTAVTADTTEGAAMYAALDTPIFFKYKGGVVTEVMAATTEPVWCLNLKKGAISLLQADLHPSFAALKTFTTTETDILGKCMSTYTVVGTPGTDFWTLNKLRHWNTCTEKMLFMGGLFSTVSKLFDTKPFIVPVVHMTMKMWGDYTHFMIKEAVLTSKYINQGLGKKTNVMATYTWQKLTHMRTITPTTPATMPTGLATKGLMMDSYSPITPTTEFIPGYLATLPDITLPANWLTEIDTMLTTYLDTTTLPETITPGHYLIKLSKTLSLWPMTHLKALIMHYDVPTDATKMKKLTLLTQLAPTLPTEYTPYLLDWIIHQGKLTGYTASVAINAWTLTSPPSPFCLGFLMHMMKSDTVIGQPLVFKATMLGLGTVANKMMKLDTEKAVPKYLTTTKLSDVLTELDTMLATTTDTEMKITLIKTMGNLGHPHMLPRLKLIIEDTNLATVVRTQAVYAMRKLATMPTMKAELTEYAVPFLLTTTETTDMKIAMFLTLMTTLPTYNTLETVVHTVVTGTDHQLKTFVYTTLFKISGCEPVDYATKQLLMDIADVMQWMPPIDVGMADSQTIISQHYDKIMDLVLTLRLSIIKSDLSALPKDIVYTYDATVLGHTFPMLEYGLLLDGLETIVKRMMRDPTLFMDLLGGEINALLRLFSSQPGPVHGAQIAEYLNQIFSRLSYEEATDQELAGLFYLKVLTYEMQYWTIDSNTLMQLITAMDMTTIGELMSTGITLDNSLNTAMVDQAVLLPTGLGLPAAVATSAGVHLGIKGTLQMTGLMAVLMGNVNTPITLTTDLTITGAYAWLNDFGCDALLMKTGAAITGSIATTIPLKAVVTFTPATGKLTVLPTPLTTPTDLAHYIMEPMTFVTVKKLTDVPTLLITTMTTTWPAIVHVKTVKFPVVIGLSTPTFTYKKITTTGKPAWAAGDTFLGKQETKITVHPIAAIKLEVDIGLNFWPAFLCRAPVTSYRTGSRDDVGEYLPVVPDPMLGRHCPPWTVPWLMTTTEATPTAALMGQITLIRTPRWLMHQFDIQTIGHGLTFMDATQTLMFKMKTGLVLNMDMETWATATPLPVMKMTTTWGAATFTANTITTTVTYGVPTTHTTFFPTEPGALTWTVDVEHSLTSTLVTGWIEEMWLYVIMPTLLPYTHKETTAMTIAPGKMMLVLEMIPTWMKLEMFLVMKTGEMWLVDIATKLPYPFTHMMPLKHMSLDQPPLNPMRNVSLLPKLPYYGTCTLTRTEVTTFDSLAIPVPAAVAGCEVMLGADCGPHKLFTVVGKYTSATAITYMITLPHAKIEVTTPAGFFSFMMSSTPTVKVNGHQISLSHEEPHIIEAGTTLTAPEFYKVWTMGRTAFVQATIHVEAMPVGLMVITDGHFIKITAVPWMQGQLCGLCGDFNADMTNDMSSTTPTGHFQAHIIPSDTCHL